MSEDNDINPELEQKSQSFQKETPKDDKDKISTNKKLTEQTQNDSDEDEQTENPSKETTKDDKEKISTNDSKEQTPGNTSTKIGKKSQSPSKIILKEQKESIPYNKIMTEQVENKSRAFLLEKMTEDFNEEEEHNGVNIKYKEQDKKMKLITLDLLLTKIVKENYIEKNPILIYSFCQQCYCFLDRKILFNKIFKCYNFYKEKKIPIEQICNLITFLNILVIEMYEYYTKIKSDDPFLVLIRKFYDDIVLEITELISEKKKKNEEEENLNINDFQNKLEEYNEDEEDKNEFDVFQDRNSAYLNDENKMRSETIMPMKEGGKYSSFFSENERGPVERNTINIPHKRLDEDDKKKKKKDEKEKKKQEKDKKKESKKKLNKIFGIFGSKKEKPVKIEDKNTKNEIQNIDDLKLKTIQQYKMGNPSSPEEAILNSIFNLMPLFSSEEPTTQMYRQAKVHLNFYNDIKGKLPEAIGKTRPPEEPKKHTMAKSVTVNDVSKKGTQLKYHENDGYFDVLDWNEKEIGEKLISISRKLISKVKRREIYKAIFLKKDKEKTSPNVMENIDKFNKLTFFIIQDILSYDFAKTRAKIIDKWLQIAEYCKKRKDYNDCVAIFSALNNYIIAGLNKTQDEVKSKAKTKELLKQLKRFCRYQGNYKHLREDMKSLGFNDFYVPYLGMILKDLAFYEENMKYIENEVLINFEKLENVQIAIMDFFHFKDLKDKEKMPIPEELNFFDNLEDIKESDMDKLASDLEPEFKLYTNKKKEKRQTHSDEKYFQDSTVNRPNMRNSKRFEQLKKSKKK